MVDAPRAEAQTECFDPGNGLAEVVTVSADGKCDNADHDDTRIRSEAVRQPRLPTKPRGCHSRRRQKPAGCLWHLVPVVTLVDRIAFCSNAGVSAPIAIMQRRSKFIGISQDDLSNSPAGEIAAVRHVEGWFKAQIESGGPMTQPLSLTR
jgi:hypothetical protein